MLELSLSPPELTVFWLLLFMLPPGFAKSLDVDSPIGPFGRDDGELSTASLSSRRLQRACTPRTAMPGSRPCTLPGAAMATALTVTRTEGDECKI
jgi:hypothetical protein